MIDRCYFSSGWVWAFQLVSMQKELQKQMTVMVAVPVAKEGKRMEGALGQRMEKVLKAHVDAMWARLAEENAKREKLERERVQQVTTLLTNFVSKDMPVAIERVFKKEFAAIGPVVAQAVLPPLQNVVATTVSESFQVNFLCLHLLSLASLWLVIYGKDIYVLAY
jgi:enhancer of mRNA-decapping protein 4